MKVIVMGFVGTGPLLLLGLLACPTTDAAENSETATNSARVVRISPPLPPGASAQFDSFRQLLKAKGAEREKLLAGRKPEHQRTLRNYLSLYDGLTPEECENRIHTMELRTIMVTLLRLAPSNRAESVKLVSERDRSLVETRLRIWETFSAEEQTEVLTNEWMIRVFSNVAAGARREGVALSGTASNQLTQMEQQAQWWRNVPESRRVRIQQNFSSIFELTDAEKAKQKLEPLPLSPEDRATMEKTLEQFRKLPPIQRAQCVQGFGKFAELSPAERRQFLINAEEWKKMTPADRERWRKLVTRMPPLPPGLLQPPMPPMPALRQPRSTTVLATNAN